MPTRVGRASPGLSEERNGRIERRDNGPGGGTDGAGEVSPGPNPLHKLGYLLHYSLSSAGFVTALSDCFQSGGRFPASGVIAFNPTRPSHAQLAGEMPPLREGDRYFWAAPHRRSNLLLPSSLCTSPVKIQFRNHAQR